MLIASAAHADDRTQPAGPLAWFDVGLGWTQPLSGFRAEDNGFGVSGLIAYFPRPGVPVGAIVGMEFQSRQTTSGSRRDRGRALVGARYVASIATRWLIAADVELGIDNISPNEKPGGVAVVSVGPRYSLGRVTLGAACDVSISKVWGYDSENGNYPEPSGVMLELKLMAGIRLQ